MQFPLSPWDRNRPHQSPPLADCVVQHKGKTFGLRAQNGILFFCDQSDPAKTWAIASLLPPEIENDKTRFETFWRREFESGRVARYLVPLIALHVFNKRQIPLFLRGDGTGWARESWNRDDVEFKHRVSLHAWLEGTDETLLGELLDVEDQLEEALSLLAFPAGTPRDDENSDIDWAGGSGARLGQIVGWVCHVEPRLWQEAGVQKVEVSVSAENAFARAHVRSLRFLPPQATARRQTRFDVEPQSDGLESSRFQETDEARFQLSNRFWELVDLALDQNTPTGVFWQYSDQGSGRCADAPYSPSIQFEVARPTVAQVEEAHRKLRAWLQSAVPTSEVELLLGDDAPRELKRQKD